MRSTAILISVLLANAAHATGAAPLMLRDAALFHDEQRIRSLINKEVLAEQQGDSHAEDQAIIAISKATDPSTRDSTSH
jgi:hypothetical protein